MIAKKKIVLLCALMLSSFLLFSQSLNLSTKRYWETNSQINAKTIKSTVDGGFIVAGNANIQFGQNNYVTGFVFYNDSSGNNHWEKIYTSFGNTFSFETVAQLNDSGFIAGGTMFNPITNKLGGALLKLDKNGNEIWKKTISDSLDAEIVISDLLIDSDTSFISIAKKTGANDGNFIIRMDTSGTILWQKSFETQGTDKVEFNSLKHASDKSLFIAGSLISSNNQSGFLMRLDSIGDVIWMLKNNYPNSSFTDILIDSNQLFCRNSTYYGEVILSSFDYNGSSLWNVKVQENDLNFGPVELSRRRLSYDVDSNLIIYCSSFSYSIFSRFSREGNYMDAISGPGTSQGIEFYSNGSCALLMGGPAYGIKSSLITNNHFAVTRFESFNSNQSFCFGGYSSQTSNIDDSLMATNLIPSSTCATSVAMMENVTAFISIDSNCVEFLGGLEENSTTDFEVHPNPAIEYLNFSIYSLGEIPEFGILIDIFGKEVLRFQVDSSDFQLNISHLQGGMYWVKLGESVKKIIIE